MADISKIGGDTPLAQSMMAAQAASSAKAIVAADPNAVKFSVDAFKSAMSNINGETVGKVVAGTKGNQVIADALQQQSMWTRLASKIPFVKSWLGSEGQMNAVIGGLQDGPPGIFAKMNPFAGKAVEVGMNKVQLTRALYGASTPNEIEQIVKSAKIADPDVAKQLIAAAKERLAGSAATSVGTNVAEKVAQQVVSGNTELAKEALGLTLRANFHGGAPTQEAILRAMESPEAAKELKALGFYAKDVKGLVARITTSTTTEVAETGATKVVQTTTTEVTAGGIASKAKGFLGKLFSGAKGNFVVAGIFSLAGNAISLYQGKIGLAQFAALTVSDTVAYGAIGWGSAAAAGAIAQAIIPIPGAGFVIGLGLGLLGGWVYDKFIRTPLKEKIGGGSAPAGYDPSSNAPAPAGPGRDPYATNPAGGQVAPPPGQGYTYEQALQAIAQMR